MSGPILVAGVDSSTQNCKYLVVDAATGEIATSIAVPHPEGTEVDPERWWDALCSAHVVNGVGVSALSIAAQQHTTIFLDGENRSVRDAILWNDSRAVPDGISLRNELGADTWLDAVGLLPAGAHPVSKLRWVARNEPDVSERIENVMVPHDWLTWRMLGGSSAGAVPTTDRSDASATGYWSAIHEQYRQDLLTVAFGRPLRVPRVLSSGEPAGTTAGGTLVGAGCGDNAATHLGLGTDAGDAVVSIGTSTTVSVISEHPALDPLGRVDTMGSATGAYLPIIAMLNGARNLTETGRMLGVSVQDLDRLASIGAPDAQGVSFLPYLDGERNPLLPGATGALVGLTRRSMAPENIARACVLGIACAVANAIDDLERVGAPVRSITVVGGGGRSPALRQAIADLTRRVVAAPVPNEYAALGAARQAAWTLAGALPNWVQPPGERSTPCADTRWVDTVRQRHDELTQNLFSLEWAQLRA